MSFTCSMFGYIKLSSINEARYVHFKSKYKPKEAAKPPLCCLKNVDLCLFPPCKRVLMGKIKRSWCSEVVQKCCWADPLANYTLLDYGFELTDGYAC